MQITLSKDEACRVLEAGLYHNLLYRWGGWHVKSFTVPKKDTLTIVLEQEDADAGSKMGHAEKS
jgi:hypothetical protein